MCTNGTSALTADRDIFECVSIVFLIELDEYKREAEDASEYHMHTAHLAATQQDQSPDTRGRQP
jgi:hypothetical protein